MKIKRHKKVHKTLNFYMNNFGFRHPFQVLIDGTFCLTALKNKINIQEQLPKYLQCDLKLLTTQCIVLETEDLGPKVLGAMKIVKQYAVHKCGHDKKRVSGSDCLKSMVKNGNPNRYFIATQDRDLQDYIRTISGVPLLYLHQTAPILEQPSEKSMELSKINMEHRFDVGKTQEIVLTKLKEESGIAEKEDKPKRRKKKKNPNPLSCLKKKKKVDRQNKVVKKESTNIHKKKRIRIPEHVKEELLKNVK